MKNSLLIGIDVGTTAVKASLFNGSGQVVSHFNQPYPIQRSTGSRVEQNPADWMQGVYAALHQFHQHKDSGNVRAIGLTSQVNTHVFVDHKGEALSPAIVWQDGRASTQAEHLDAQVSDDQRMAWWGAPLPIDASHALSRMQWLLEEDKYKWDATCHVLLPKDYCLLELTGEIVSDPLSNIGLVNFESCFIPELLGLVPGALERLPELNDMTALAGVVKPGLPFAGTPVSVGTMDAWAGLFGCAVTSEQEGVYLSGTSEILGIISQSITPTPGVLVMPPAHNITLHVGPTQSGGASQMWFCDLMGIEPVEMAELASLHPSDKPYPLFLPHLQGERAPLWDATARGVFIGLDASSDRAALARSVYDGVACSARLLLDSLQASSGVKLQALSAGGGGFRNPVWNQIRANVLGVPIDKVAVDDPGTLGAAGLAAVAVGLYENVQQAFEQLVKIDQQYEPEKSLTQFHADRMHLYKETYENTRTISSHWA